MSSERQLPDTDGIDSNALRRLLFVDDEENVLHALKRVFRRSGYQIDTVGSPLEALLLIAAHDYDLLLVDFCMPEMNGVDLLKQAQAAGHKINAILLTGNADTSAAFTAIQEGLLDRFLLKPWDDATLRQAVAEVIGR
jgi:DNA-binding NtrC family response regulator